MSAGSASRWGDRRARRRRTSVSVLPIRHLGHPVLRERAREVSAEELARRRSSADRRHDRDDARRQRRGHRRQPGRRAGAHRDRRGRGRQPALPVQAADPAHRRRQPGDRAARRRGGRRSTRAASRCRTCAARCRVTCTSGCATSTATASSTTRCRRGLTRRDLPARGRPPRRDPVRRPRRPAHAHHLGAVRARHDRDAFDRAHHRVRGAGRLLTAYLVRAGLARRRPRRGRRAGRGRGRPDRLASSGGCRRRRGRAARRA